MDHNNHMEHSMSYGHNAYEDIDMKESLLSNASNHLQDINQLLNSTSDLKAAAQLSSPERQHHHHHQGMASHSMSMSMTFHGGYLETILFSWWKVTDVGEFVGSFIAIFIMALLYEGLKYYRKHLLWKTYTGLQYCAVSPPDKGVANMCAAEDPQVIQPVPHVLDRNIPTMMSSAHVWQTGLHGVQVFVSYMLMLVFMTYNVWLCAAVVLGSATGYFLFGWRESVVVDFTEHCH
ncbi:unnamed protein product [Leptidea sinapis]|uniref:Copper transport protein n=1 Tax=Leptidea sinapis TaxID=189913 RepID=A0A5E4Q321_9NEOP|nr:unnamed protein product [Leptidea sinapis]